MTPPEDGWVTLATIVRPQGRKGEVLADLFTDFPESLAGRGGLSLLPAKGDRRPATVENAWLPKGRSEGRVVLKFAGTESINDAETLTGFRLQVQPSALARLDSGSYYIHDLMGCEVWHAELLLGTVVRIDCATDANGGRLPEHPETLVIGGADGAEVLIPFVAAFVDSVDVTERRISMRLPDGLVEANG